MYPETLSLTLPLKTFPRKPRRRNLCVLSLSCPFSLLGPMMGALQSALHFPSPHLMSVDWLCIALGEQTQVQFSNNVTSVVLGVRPSTNQFGRDTIQPITQVEELFSISPQALHNPLGESPFSPHIPSDLHGFKENRISYWLELMSQSNSPGIHSKNKMSTYLSCQSVRLMSGWDGVRQEAPHCLEAFFPRAEYVQGCHRLRPEKSISLNSAPKLPRLPCLVLIPLLVVTGLGAGSGFF